MRSTWPRLLAVAHECRVLIRAHPHSIGCPPSRCEALYDRLMELDDVDAVYTNAGG